MNIFELHSAVVADYRDFVRSYFSVADDRPRAYVENTLDDQARLRPDLLLQISPSCSREAAPRYPPVASWMCPRQVRTRILT